VGQLFGHEAERTGVATIPWGVARRRVYRRETNTMPQWAGSCWYELRYLDPTNDKALVDPNNERYWMGPRQQGDCGGVDLYVGGVEHAVLHLLYARFWHKVLYDLGHISSFEPFRRLFNQGYIQAYAYLDARGQYVPAAEVVAKDGKFFYQDQPVTQTYGKMGKTEQNVVTPDEMCETYGADTFRFYEMSMGPMEVSRPWATKDVVGAQRFLQRLWRNVVDEVTGEVRITDDSPTEDDLRQLHRAIAGAGDDYKEMRFNTAGAKLIELNNHITKTYSSTVGTPRALAEPLVQMLAPLAPHIAEELWARLGHADTLTYETFPNADPGWLVEETVEVPVQVNGKVRERIKVPIGATEAEHEQLARANPRIAALLEGKTVQKVIVVRGRLVNFVVT
jgi:leucyl-tRNA synthetase